jgi:hypothetical protein
MGSTVRPWHPLIDDVTHSRCGWLHLLRLQSIGSGGGNITGLCKCLYVVLCAHHAAGRSTDL